MKTGLHLSKGLRVGLLGGSFDPAHKGHAHITREALRRFALDRVIWLVSPGNPLKEHGPAPLAQRMERARQVMDDPRVTISDAESRLGTRYTADTIATLQSLHQGVNFVWLMGADNLRQFHLWEDWQGIMQSVPVGVLARPGDRISARMSPAARVFQRARLRQEQSHMLPISAAPAWCFVNVPMASQSSTAIRAKGGWSNTAAKGHGEKGEK